MSKHTPGPWKKSERLNGPWWHISSGHSIDGQECGSGRQAIACVHGESKRGSKAYAEMFEANAILISAAPDLLQALIRLVERDTADGIQYSGDHPITVARSAIYKATGVMPDSVIKREKSTEHQQIQSEPLAWLYEDTLPFEYPYNAMFVHSRIIDGVRMFPVYGPQPKRDPLTDEHIRSMCKQTWVFETVKQWIRIVEATHGIK